MSSCQEHFHAVLKAEFGPKLREAGFKGSGHNYRRVIGDAINAINIQGNPWGGSCMVNLGIHLTFLPDTLNKVRDPATFKVINCEFDRRISDDTTSDGWWSYGDTVAVAEASARSLIRTFLTKGEPYSRHYSTVPTILSALICQANRTTEPPPGLCGIGPTPVRAALTAARILRFRGEIAESRRLAQIGLTTLGDARALKTELETLAGQATA